MITSLKRRLDVLLEDNTADDPLQSALDLTAKLEEARRNVNDLEKQLMYAVDRMCGNLAMKVRQSKPALSVSLGNGGCKVGYRSKHLMFKPDLAKRTWQVDSHDPSFARRYARSFASPMLDQDVVEVSKCIADFFSRHYRSLGEDIVGDGKATINGIVVEDSDLEQFANRRINKCRAN